MAIRKFDLTNKEWRKISAEFVAENKKWNVEDKLQILKSVGVDVEKNFLKKSD